MKVFLSYGTNDAAFASSLRDEIQNSGVEVLDAKWEVAGFDGLQFLRNGLEDSNALILIVPQRGSNHANNALFEAGAAKAMGKRVYSVMFDSTGREFPVGMAEKPIFDAERKSPGEVAKDLVAALRAV